MDAGRIAANLKGVQARVESRCLANGVDPSGVRIIGITKTIPVEMASEGVKAGLTDLGENRVQEAAGKIPMVSPRPRWHLVGHLQKNKVRKAVEIFDVIESVDSLELARLISKRACEMGKTMEMHIQVNSSYESSKHGFDPAEIFDFADKINELPGLMLSGLMTIGPLTDDLEQLKKAFAMTRNLYDRLKTRLGSGFEVLSMGMSGDFELALDYGANALRIGTAIFGPRSMA
jgi:pyridoxal phosphate enzyme (YggS family)